MIILLNRLGVSIGTMHILSIPGCKTGKMRSTPVSILLVNGQQYILAGMETGWVKNARSASRGLLSYGREKAVQRVARLHRKIRKQRNDSLHQWSRRLVNTYETIVFEDIQPANLSKRAKPKKDEETGKYLPNGASAKSGRNKSLLDAGWHQFITLCTYKAEEAGGRIVLVDSKYTSQVCSNCGTIRKKTLDERWHSCECGCELDRDHNAAINIRNLWLGRSRQEA